MAVDPKQYPLLAEIQAEPIVTPSAMRERGVLRLDSSKAIAQLGWRPLLDLPTALDWAVEWHLAERSGSREALIDVVDAQIDRYFERDRTAATKP